MTKKEINKLKRMSANQIALDILKNLDHDTKMELFFALPDCLGSYSTRFHFTLGAQIRSDYHLWERSDVNPDDFSGKIIDILAKLIKEQKLPESKF